MAGKEKRSPRNAKQLPRNKLAENTTTTLNSHQEKARLDLETNH